MPTPPPIPAPIPIFTSMERPELEVPPPGLFVAVAGGGLTAEVLELATLEVDGAVACPRDWLNFTVLIRFETAFKRIVVSTSEQAKAVTVYEPPINNFVTTLLLDTSEL